MKNIAIFASGSGSNAENIATFFEKSSDVSVKLILTNNSEAYVIKRAQKLNLPTIIFSRQEINNPDGVLQILKDNNIDYIVLAGFLWLLPEFLVEAYPSRIINIHPSLLPKYGGKGMYGDKVHKAVVEAGETKSGITIHRVDANYDSGAIISQIEVSVLPSDSADDVATKVHALEYEHFPKVIAQELAKL